MSRLSVFLAATISLLFCSLAFSQTSGTAPVRPGSATTAPLPGMPAPGARPQAGTARIRGRIVAAQTGAPLRRAQVTLGSSTAGSARTMTTDGDGRFEFAQLPPGRYTLSANKAGYVSLQYGQRRPNDPMTPLIVEEDERRDGVNFALPRGGVIAARVVDEFGEPLAGAQVQVQRYQYGPDGQRRLNTVLMTSGMLGPSGTDDRGEIRLFGLSPGEYLVSASMRNQLLAAPGGDANSDGFAPTFHPGTINPNEAQAVTVGLGEETSIEFAMSSARLTRVSGTAVDSQGRPATGSIVQLLNRQANGVFGGGGAQVGPDGSFTLNGIAPGEYSLEVRTQLRFGSAEGGEFGATSIVVAGTEITGLRIVTGKGATITGRVVFEGTAPRSSGRGQPAPLRVLPTPADTATRFAGPVGTDPRTNGTVDENGRFQLTGVSGRVFLFVTTPAGWTTKSISLDGEDVTDEPIDLTGQQSVAGMVIRLTDKLTQIAGHVSDARGQRSRECTVVFQTADERDPVVAARLMRLTRCDSTGAFQMRGMRPGRYVVTAVTSIEQNRQYEPEYREQLRRASQSIVIREGETITIDLKLSGF